MFARKRKLTYEQAQEIRELSIKGFSGIELSKKYKVHPVIISQIINEKKYIPEEKWNKERKKMKIETHNKKFSYEIDNNRSLIIYKTELSKEGEYESIVTGREVSSAVFTPDDRYLYVLSKLTRNIYIYYVNLLSGTLILHSQNLTVSNDIEKLSMSKSGFYLTANGKNLIPFVFSINQKNGELILYSMDKAKEILQKETFYI